MSPCFKIPANVFNFNCGHGFPHVSYIWPDRKFKGKSNGTDCKLIGVTTTKLYIYIIRVKSHLSVCLSAFHLMSRIVLSNRCAFGSIFGVMEALIIELNNDAFEKFVQAIVSRLEAVEGRCVD